MRTVAERKPEVEEEWSVCENRDRARLRESFCVQLD